MLSLFNRCLFVLACSILPVFSQNVTLQGGTLEGARESFSAISDPRLILWLQADKGLTFNTTGTTSVSGWADQSGYGNNAFQATKANQPGHVTNAISGNFSVKFDGANDFLSVTNKMVSDLMNGDDKPYDCIIFLKQTTNGNDTVISWGNNTNSTPTMYLRPCTSALNISQFHTDDAGVNVTSTLLQGDTNNFVTISALHNGKTVNLGRAFTFSAALNSDVGPMTVDRFTIGAFGRNGTEINNFHGEICEILLYNTNISLTIRNNIVEYFGNRYGKIVHP